MTEPSLLDIELLDESAEAGVDGLRELIDMYFAQADQITGSLRVAIEGGRPNDVEHFAHKLAGSSAVCGVAAVTALLRTLEQRGRQRELSDADQLMAAIDDRLELCRRLLDEYLAEKGG